MALSKDGAPVQVPAAMRAASAPNLRSLFDLITADVRVGNKYDAPCLTAGVPLEPGSSRKDNFGFAQVLFLDLDEGAITSEAEATRLRAWMTGRAGMLFSTSRHDPEREVFRYRALLLLDHSLTYLELAAVADAFRSQLIAFQGIPQERQAAVDACNARAFQPMLVPRFADERIARQFESYFFEGPSWPVATLLEEARQKIALEAQKKKSRATAATFCASTSSLLRVDPSEDTLASLERDLDALGPIVAGGGRSDKLLFRAAVLAAEWDLSEAEATDRLTSKYSTQDPRWIRHKVGCAYRSPTIDRGRRLRRQLAETELTLEPIVQSNKVIRYNQRYLPPLRLDRLSSKVVFVKSAQGTGKNVSLTPAIEQALADGKRVVTVSHRISLARGHARTWDLDCYTDTDGPLEASTSVCLDSIERLQLLDLCGEVGLGVLILDEWEQLVRHIFGGTISSKNMSGRIFCRLRELFRQAERIVVQDADLSPLGAFTVRLLMGWDDSSKYDETWILNDFVEPRVVDFYSQEEEWVARLRETIECGMAVWVYGTSKTSLDVLAKDLRQRFPSKSLLLVHSKTTGTADARACLDDPSLFAAFDIVLCSPSVGTGVSVDVKGHFQVFGHAQSGAGPTALDVLQGLCRVRHPTGPWVLYTGGQISHGKTNPEEILEDLQAMTSETLECLRRITTWSARYDEDLEETQLAPHDFDLCRLFAEVRAHENRWGNCLHDIIAPDGKRVPGALRRHLERCGHIVRDMGDTLDPEVSKDLKRELADARKQRKDDIAAAVAAAPPTSLQTAEELMRDQPTPENAAALHRAQICDFYGVDVVTPDLARRDDEGRHRRKVRTAVRIQTWQTGDRQALSRLDRTQAKLGLSVSMRHVLRSTGLIGRILHLCGIKDLRADAQAKTLLHDLGPICVSEDLRRELKRYLNISVAADTPTMVLVSRILALAGIKLKCDRPRVNNPSRSRRYWIDPVSAEQALEDGWLYEKRLTDPHEVHHGRASVNGPLGVAADVDSMVQTLMEELEAAA